MALRQAPPATDADAVLAVCRVLVGVSVRSMSAVQDAVGVLQLRILTVIASRGAVTLSELAAATGLHMSRASRTCERMASAGLIERRSDPEDRRSLQLTSTPNGRRIVADVAAARRAAIAPVLDRMSEDSRRGLLRAMRELSDAAGEPAEIDLWTLGWTTAPRTQLCEEDT